MKYVGRMDKGHDLKEQEYFMLPSDQLQASLDIHLLDATISIAGCTRVERGNGASPCSSRLTPACRMLLHAFTSLSFLHLRRCSTHSVDLHLMLRWHSPHFSASFQQPAQSFVVLYSGVAMTCTYRLAVGEEDHCLLPIFIRVLTRGPLHALACAHLRGLVQHPRTEYVKAHSMRIS